MSVRKPKHAARARRVRETPFDLLLLDTHIWYWMAEEKVDEVAKGLPAIINRAADEGRTCVSAISAWELGLLVAKGRIRLAVDLTEWIAGSTGPRGVRLLDVTADIAVASTRLPGRIHGDPADRIIIATARDLGATLVTRDERILDYGRAGYLRVLNASL